MARKPITHPNWIRFYWSDGIELVADFFIIRLIRRRNSRSHTRIGSDQILWHICCNVSFIDSPTLIARPFRTADRVSSHETLHGTRNRPTSNRFQLRSHYRVETGALMYCRADNRSDNGFMANEPIWNCLSVLLKSLNRILQCCTGSWSDGHCRLSFVIFIIRVGEGNGNWQSSAALIDLPLIQMLPIPHSIYENCVVRNCCISLREYRNNCINR